MNSSGLMKNICAAAVLLAALAPAGTRAQEQKKTAEQGTAPARIATPQTREEMEKEIARLRSGLDDLSKRVGELEQQSDPVYGLKLSGVFDVNISNFKNQPNVFDIGGFELDLEHAFKNNFQVAAALVFEEGAVLSTGFIDYHLFGGRIAPRGRIFAGRGFHIQVGKFDVPFGCDWRSYVSSDRVSVTKPLTTEKVMEGGYNDVGIRFLGNFRWVNFTVYGLRGIDAAHTFGGNSYGGRLGFTPFHNPYTLKRNSIPLAEIGVSYIHDLDRSGKTAEMLMAVDFESKAGPVIMAGEYYRRDKAVGLLYEGAQGMLGLDLEVLSPAPLIMFFRYDYYRVTRYKAAENSQWLHRISAGLNCNISHVSYVKVEYTRYLEYFREYMTEEYFNPNLIYVQLVITF